MKESRGGKQLRLFGIKMKKYSSYANKRKKNNRPGLFLVFFVTLSLVILTGMAGILTYKALQEKRSGTEQSVPVSADTDTRKQDTEGISWEKIPEGVTKRQASEESYGEKGEGDNANTRYGAELADEEYMKANRILAWESSSKEEVAFGFVGDILLDDEYAIMANLLQRGVTIENGISDVLLAEMRNVDIMVVNNEFPYTDRGIPTEGKMFTFRADTDTVSYLHDMGADVAILANNHIYDFGETGLMDTLDTLVKAGIPGIGAGKNIDEASAPLYFIANDTKIALVAATQIERLDNPDTKGATQDTAGVFRCLNPEKLYEVVAEAKKNSDFVIVYIHWGTEFESKPDWAQLEQAPGLAQAGADLIIGDHPHCLQGIEFFGDTPVIYSLGNFWFNSRTVDTGMVRVTIGQEGMRSFQFIPAIQSGCRVDLAYGEERERILAYMRELSPNVQIDAEGYVSKK